MNDVISIRAFADELTKIADVLPAGEPVDVGALVDPNNPNDPITRYQSMQRRRPILRDVVREGVIGAAAVPALTTARELLGKGVAETFKRPALKNVAGEVSLGGHLSPGGFGRKALAGAAIGSVAGGLVPLLRSHVALKAEEENVKQQLGMTPEHGVRSAIRRTVGVG